MGMLDYPALLWAQWAQLIQSLFKGEFDEENNSDHQINGTARDPNTQISSSAPTSSTSQLADLEKEASILDLEAGRLNINASPSSSSSSSLSSSIKYSNNQRSLPAAAKQKQPIVLPAVYTRRPLPSSSSSSSSLSSSSHLPSVLVSLPCIINTNQNPNPNNIPAPPAEHHHHHHQEGGGGGGGLNPIAQIFRDQDFGRMIIGFPMPLAGMFATPYAPTSSMVRNLVFLSLSLGVAALWNGILLRNVLPIRYANFTEQIGAAFVLLAVFGLFSSFLPLYLLWIPWACFLAVLFPICLSFRWG